MLEGVGRGWVAGPSWVVITKHLQMVMTGNRPEVIQQVLPDIVQSSLRVVDEGLIIRQCLMTGIARSWLRFKYRGEWQLTRRWPWVGTGREMLGIEGRDELVVVQEWVLVVVSDRLLHL